MACQKGHEPGMRGVVTKQRATCKSGNLHASLVSFEDVEVIEGERDGDRAVLQHPEGKGRGPAGMCAWTSSGITVREHHETFIATQWEGKQCLVELDMCCSSGAHPFKEEIGHLSWR